MIINLPVPLCHCLMASAKVRLKLEYLPSAAAALIVRKSIESRCVRCVAGGGTSQYFVTRLQSCGRARKPQIIRNVQLFQSLHCLQIHKYTQYTHMGSEMLWPRVPGVLVLVSRFMVSINKAEAAVPRRQLWRAVTRCSHIYRR